MPQVITRPAEPARILVGDGGAQPMSNDVANALTTGRVLTEATLKMAMAHYARLAELLIISGPAFSASRVIAVQMHNKCVARLREDLSTKDRRAREAAIQAAGLLEID